jgi:hypothetical protein
MLLICCLTINTDKRNVYPVSLTFAECCCDVGIYFLTVYTQSSDSVVPGNMAGNWFQKSILIVPLYHIIYLQVIQNETLKIFFYFLGHKKVVHGQICEYITSLCRQQCMEMHIYDAKLICWATLCPVH